MITAADRHRTLNRCTECGHRFARNTLASGKLERLDQYRTRRTCSAPCMSDRRSRLAADRFYARPPKADPTLGPRVETWLRMVWAQHGRTVARSARRHRVTEMISALEGA